MSLNPAIHRIFFWKGLPADALMVKEVAQDIGSCPLYISSILVNVHSCLLGLKTGNDENKCTYVFNSCIFFVKLLQSLHCLYTPLPTPAIKTRNKLFIGYQHLLTREHLSLEPDPHVFTYPANAYFYPPRAHFFSG